MKQKVLPLIIEIALSLIAGAFLIFNVLTDLKHLLYPQKT